MPTTEEKVRGKFPHAHIEKSGEEFFLIWKTSEKFDLLGWGRNETEAWKNAAEFQRIQ